MQCILTNTSSSAIAARPRCMVG